MRRRSAALLALALLLPLPGLAGEVVVKPGDTLGELAERYGTTVERLMQLNGLRSPLVIVCGGSAATWPQLQRWRDERALS